MSRHPLAPRTGAVRPMDQMTKDEGIGTWHGFDSTEYRGQSGVREGDMKKGGLGWVPFVCCVFIISYTRELRGISVRVCL